MVDGVALRKGHATGTSPRGAREAATSGVNAAQAEACARCVMCQRLGGGGSGERPTPGGGVTGTASISCATTANGMAAASLTIATALPHIATQAACVALSLPPQSIPPM